MFPQYSLNGILKGKTYSPVVPQCVLSEIYEWISSGISKRKTEGLKEKLRSIVAQFEFQHILKQWEERGVNFRTYMYVPEVHPDTGEYFCEREDEAHVLKVGH